LPKVLQAIVLTAFLCVGVAAQGAARPEVVSSKLSSESAKLGQMIRLLLEDHGIPTVDRMTLGATPIVRKALLAGEIDLYVEYTGNAGFFFNRPDDPAWKDLQRGYDLGASLDLAANRIVWLEPARASNSWALAVRRDLAEQHGLVTMSDFARWTRAGARSRCTAGCRRRSRCALPTCPTRRWCRHRARAARP
jgi:osmoprotectant transport system substrate-binding protein